MGIERVAAAAIVSAICAMVVRRRCPEIGVVLALGAGALLLLGCSGALEGLAAFWARLAALSGVAAGVIEPVAKVTGVALITRLAADFCRDAQEQALAGTVELAGAALALAAALPLFSGVLDLLDKLLGE